MELQDYIFIDENKLNGFERKAYSQMIEEVGEDILDKYNYKLATFWHMFDLDENQIKQLHPIVFTYGVNRNHLLPSHVLSSLNPDQIYNILKGTNKSFTSIEDYIIRIWLNTCEGYSLDKEYLIKRCIPIWNTYVQFPRNLEQLYKIRKVYMRLNASIKPLQFYQDTNSIGVRDFFMFIDNICPTMVHDLVDTIHSYCMFDDAFETESIMNYQKVLEIINKNYGYRELTNIENALSLNEVSRKVFYYYFENYFENDREAVLKRIVYIFEYRKETNKIPHLQLSKRKFIYFLDDVLDYIDKTIIK